SRIFQRVNIVKIAGHVSYSSCWLTSRGSQLVDETGRVAGAETIVDVDDGDAAGAGVEHGQQRGDAAEACAVADARGHGDDRLVHEAADEARQRAFHAGDDDEDVGFEQFVIHGQQPMDTGHTDVVEPLHAVAHDLNGDDSLLG